MIIRNPGADGKVGENLKNLQGGYSERTGSASAKRLQSMFNDTLIMFLAIFLFLAHKNTAS
jgi:hypothetical protein